MIYVLWDVFFKFRLSCAMWEQYNSSCRSPGEEAVTLSLAGFCLIPHFYDQTLEYYFKFS